MTRFLFTLGFVLLPAAVFAQHPCDVSVPSSGQVLEGQVVSAEFCVPATDNLEAVAIYRNGTATQLSPLQLLTPTPNASGFVQFRVAVGSFQRGTYQVVAAGINRGGDGSLQEGGPSSPFSLSVVAAISAPAAPRNLNLRVP